jgi:hypothetical protein
MAKSAYSGSCLCGRVKFEIEGAFDSFFLCHCKYCQKDTGSAHGANLFSTSASLRWVSGENGLKNFNLPSTQHVKSFCEECGSALPNIQMAGKLLVVPAGSLDTELDLKPTAHIFHGSKARWEDGLESVRKFENLPS